MLQRIFRDTFGKRGHTVIHELLHCSFEIIESFRDFDAVLVKHVFVVVHHDIFAVVRDAVPVTGSHNAFVVVLTGSGQRT